MMILFNVNWLVFLSYLAPSCIAFNLNRHHTNRNHYKVIVNSLSTSAGGSNSNSKGKEYSNSLKTDRKNIEIFNEAKQISLSQSLPLTDNTNLDSISAKNDKIKVFKKPEVLAPAGGWEQLKAAAANGADACYFGLQEGFNARARASNFPLDEIPQVMEYLHDRGMKGYIVVNILVFDSELIAFQKIMKAITDAGDFCC